MLTMHRPQTYGDDLASCACRHQHVVRATWSQSPWPELVELLLLGESQVEKVLSPDNARVWRAYPDGARGWARSGRLHQTFSQRT